MVASGVVQSVPRGPRAVTSVWGTRVMGLVALLLAWEALSRSGLLYSGITPSAASVAAAGWKLLAQASFYSHFWVTAGEIVAAFVIGSLLGVVVGVIGGAWRALGAAIDPYLHYLAPTPKIIFLPIMMLLFGAGAGSKVALGVISAFFPVAVATIAGMRQVPRVLVNTGRSFHLTRTQMVLKVYLPAISQPLSIGLGLGIGSAVTGVLLGECKFAREGLGFLIMDAYRFLRIPEMYALLILSFALAVSLNLLVEHVGRRWNRT
jgi:NitT/TauT family transport system permease protein